VFKEPNQRVKHVTELMLQLAKCLALITETFTLTIANIQILQMLVLAMELIILYLKAWYRQHSWIQAICTILIAVIVLSKSHTAQIIWILLNKIVHSFILLDIFQTLATRWFNSITIWLRITRLILLRLECQDLQLKGKFAKELMKLR
jgi:hypothetical protein